MIDIKTEYDDGYCAHDLKCVLEYEFGLSHAEVVRLAKADKLLSTYKKLLFGRQLSQRLKQFQQ